MLIETLTFPNHPGNIANQSTYRGRGKPEAATPLISNGISG
jgi:hypothetical protein